MGDVTGAGATGAAGVNGQVVTLIHSVGGEMVSSVPHKEFLRRCHTKRCLASISYPRPGMS